jgi:hypothetical protein
MVSKHEAMLRMSYLFVLLIVFLCRTSILGVSHGICCAIIVLGLPSLVELYQDDNKATTTNSDRQKRIEQTTVTTGTTRSNEHAIATGTSVQTAGITPLTTYQAPSAKTTQATKKMQAELPNLMEKFGYTDFPGSFNSLVSSAVVNVWLKQGTQPDSILQFTSIAPPNTSTQDAEYRNFLLSFKAGSGVSGTLALQVLASNPSLLVSGCFVWTHMELQQPEKPNSLDLVNGRINKSKERGQIRIFSEHGQVGRPVHLFTATPWDQKARLDTLKKFRIFDLEFNLKVKQCRQVINTFIGHRSFKHRGFWLVAGIAADTAADPSTPSSKASSKASVYTKACFLHVLFNPLASDIALIGTEKSIEPENLDELVRRMMFGWDDLSEQSALLMRYRRVFAFKGVVNDRLVGTDVCGNPKSSYLKMKNNGMSLFQPGSNSNPQLSFD